MCLLSVYSPGATVNIEHLRNGADCNPHGYGYALIGNGAIESGHGMDSEAVIEAFDRARTIHPAGWALFHSRYTTDGLTTVDNCHPFIVGGDPRTVLAHNGILPDEARPGKGDPRSDTRILAEDLIPGGKFGRLNARGRRRLAKWLLRDDYPNKVAILTVDPRFSAPCFILNEDLGTWVNGVWHSNSGYLPTRRNTYRSSYWWDDASTEPTDASESYSRYRSGQITYSEHLDNVLGAARRMMTDCDICDAVGTVNRVYGYCRNCKCCADCYVSLDDCDCWSPDSVDQVVAALERDRAEYGTPADHVPMALTGPSPEVTPVPEERC